MIVFAMGDHDKVKHNSCWLFSYVIIQEQGDFIVQSIMHIAGLCISVSTTHSCFS